MLISPKETVARAYVIDPNFQNITRHVNLYYRDGNLYLQSFGKTEEAKTFVSQVGNYVTKGGLINNSMVVTVGQIAATKNWTERDVKSLANSSEANSKVTIKLKTGTELKGGRIYKTDRNKLTVLLRFGSEVIIEYSKIADIQFE